MNADTDPKGLPAELEAAITEFEIATRYAEIANTVGAQSKRTIARAALVAAIAKYGNTNWLVGYDYRKNEESQEGLVDE